jgi:hypothetical protein
MNTLPVFCAIKLDRAVKTHVHYTQLKFFHHYAYDAGDDTNEDPSRNSLIQLRDVLQTEKDIEDYSPASCLVGLTHYSS